MVAAAMPMLLGFTGLAVDAGTWYHGQQRLQMAADAAALGAARLLPHSSAGQLVLEAAALNEAMNVVAGTAGTLNAPAVVIGANRANVAVTLSSSAPLYFSGLFLSQPVTLRAKATAAPPTSVTCVMATSTTAASAIKVFGHGTIAAPACAVFSNSSAADAIYMQGNASSLTGASIGTVGTVGGSIGNVQPSASTGQPAKTDPYAKLTPPPDEMCPNGKSTVYSGSNQQLSPGTYCGGLTLSSTSITLLPGVYNILNGDFTISKSSNVDLTGVSFYLGGSAPGGLNWGANQTITMSASTSGWLQGILIYQDRRASATSKITGNSTLSLAGTIYMPSAGLDLSGTFTMKNSSQGGLAVIANTITVGGTATIQAGGGNIPITMLQRMVLTQ